MLAYLGLPLDLFGKVGVGLPISNTTHVGTPHFAGCFFPAIPSITTVGYD